jgi:hypothetical protein
MTGLRLQLGAAVLATMGGMVMDLGTRSAEAALAPSKASMLVTLRSSGATCGASPWKALDTRVNPDGTLSPFVIPEGRVLVVTSVDWRQGLIAAGQHSEFFLFPSATNISINYPIAQAVGAGAGPTGGGSFVVTGTVIGPGTPCWGINDLSNIGSADALVHGFLAPNK